MQFLHKNILLFTILILTLSGAVHAQLWQVPVQKHSGKTIPHYGRQQEEPNEEPAPPLTLPFWDDFSTSDGFPNPALWEHGRHVAITEGMGINPPTIKVATFDGWDEMGRPYSNNNMAAGPADSLVSRPIDLSVVPADRRNTVFISFFWQLKGNGEMPDQEDRIRLQFWTKNKQWVTAWEKFPEIHKDPNRIDPSIYFQQEVIQIVDSLLHDGFKFRFQSFNRLSGNFDNWHIDYIYLHHSHQNWGTEHEAGETPTMYFFDRALSTPPTSIFKEYNAIPFLQFFKKPDLYLSDSIYVHAFNLSKSLQPVDYYVILKDESNNEIITELNIKTASSLNGRDKTGKDKHKDNIIRRIGMFSSSLINKDPIIAYAENQEKLEKLWIKADFFIETGDNAISPNVDFRINDRASNIFKLDNFFAYDDSSAEFGAGINQRGGLIAYQFFLHEQDTLTHIDVHFPIIGRNQDGTTLSLKVWKRLSNEREDVLHDQIEVVRHQNGMNAFSRYALSSPLIVKDTIFIGWEQMTSEFLAVGLDKNTNSGDKIWYNVGNTWRQNNKNTGVAGSLMLRPVFEKGAIVTSIGNQHLKKEKVLVFPNPTQGVIHFRGAFQQIKVYDGRGAVVREAANLHKEDHLQIDLSGLHPGMYFLHIMNKHGIQIEKVFLNK